MSLKPKQIAIIAVAVVVTGSIGIGLATRGKGGEKDTDKPNVIINAGDNNNNLTNSNDVKTDDNIKLDEVSTEKKEEQAKTEDIAIDIVETKGSILGDWQTDDGYSASFTQNGDIIDGTWMSSDKTFEYAGVTETDNSTYITIHATYKVIDGKVVDLESPEDIQLTIVGFDEDDEYNNIILTIKDSAGTEYQLKSYASLDIPDELKEIIASGEADKAVEEQEAAYQGQIDAYDQQAMEQAEAEREANDAPMQDGEYYDTEALDALIQ